MLFNSLSFIFIFLPITLAGYYWTLSNHNTRSQYSVLIIASLIFYGYWDIRFIPLLIFSIVINYFLARVLISSQNKIALVIGIGFNLGLIAWFKFIGFFTASLACTGFSISVVETILPLGISFFTFQQIAYLVDAYQGKIANHDPYEYTLFVVFFPQLIAGPIVHHREIVPQFQRQRNSTGFWESPLLTHGLILFIVGLFKKVVLADNLAIYVDPVFSDANSATFLEAWTAAIAYTLQLYFDFCGYSEMAMGIALMFGIRLPLNFNSPYKATSIIDFWRRWHITLGRFLKVYLYLPLGGNQRGTSRMLLAIFLTMLLGGLWHGAGWTFIVWGLLQGIYLSINHLWNQQHHTLPTKVAWWLTFTAVVIAWVIFRANSLSDAGILLLKMSGSEGLQFTPLYELMLGSLMPNINSQYSSVINGFEIMLMGLIMLFLTRTANIHQQLVSFTPTRKKQTYFSVMTGIVIFSLNTPTTFLYHQF